MLCARKFVKVSEESYETVNKIPSALRQLHGIEVEKDGLWIFQVAQVLLLLQSTYFGNSLYIMLEWMPSPDVGKLLFPQISDAATI